MKNRILNYIKAGYPCLYIVSQEEQRVEHLMRDAMIDLNTKLSDAPGWRLIGALAINDKGLIAAQASLNNGPARAVLLVPVGRVGPVTPLCQPSVFG
jgi:hypothetical protein